MATTTSYIYGNLQTGGLQNTGMYVADNYSNIHDMLGNVYEWTTEYSSDSSNFCVHRGGSADVTILHAASRYKNNDTNGYNIIGFRTQLYIK